MEALHQARVALRRVRAAFSIFGPLVGKEELAPLKARLKRLFRKLGRARNMDVYIAKLPGEATEEPASLELIQKVTRRRERAYDEVIGQLGAVEYRSLMLDLSALVEIEAWAGDRFRGSIARQTILDLASRTLDRQWRRIHTIDRRVDRLGSRQLHRLRIWAKTFRYTCDFFGGAFVKPKAGKRYRRFTARLGELQDALGTLNDLTTNRKLTKKFATHSGHDGKRGRRAKADLLSAAARIHSAMLKMKPFW